MAWFAYLFFILALITLRHYGVLGFGPAFLVGFWGSVGSLLYFVNWVTEENKSGGLRR